jgi:glycosyltransferase involved in cell wall biosynthesis
VHARGRTGITSVQHTPLISVVIPTYNRRDTISYCLDSVLSQTYDNLEVIVVDDCSTDDTVSIVKNYSDPRVRSIILEKNSGAQAARNRGIFEANADWIAFQDSDDEWMPDKLEKQVAALARANFDPWLFIYTNAFLFDTVKGSKKVWLLPVVEGAAQHANLLQSPAPLYQTMLVSKEALRKIEYLDENVPSFQEWDTSIRLAKYCTIIHIKEPLLIYHVGDGSAISGNKTKNIQGWYYIISKHEDDIKKYCGENAWQKLILQLLRKCLNFGLIDYYDSYRSKLSLSNEDLLKMLYLIFCRKLCIRADNGLYRIIINIYHHFISIITQWKK